MTLIDPSDAALASAPSRAGAEVSGTAGPATHGTGPLVPAAPTSPA